MSSKPGVFALSKESTLFTFSNVKLFFNHIKIIFPLMLLCIVIKQAGLIAKAEWIAPCITAASLFLCGCFALAWHRTSLYGPDKSHERNPTNLRGEDWKFVLFFMLLTGGFGLFLDGLVYLNEKILAPQGEGIGLVGNIVTLVVIFFATVTFARASFLFPAKSVGVNLSWQDAKRASKGLIWPLIGSNIIFGMIFVVAVTVYLSITGYIVFASFSNGTRFEAVVAGLVLATPILLASLYVLALCITALSRAYQWGIQNNEATPA